MSQKSQSDQFVDAFSIVYKTLEPLDEQTRMKVLASISSSLGMPSPNPSTPPTPPAGGTPPPPVGGSAGKGQTNRPLSLNELVNDKDPASHAQKLALFAFYREKVEDKPRFSRADLKEYYSTAKLKPPGNNFDREFVRTVKLGWIHEDGAESYLTTKGLEAVEEGFGGKALPRGSGTSKRKSTKKKSSPKKSAKKKSKKATTKKRGR